MCCPTCICPPELLGNLHLSARLQDSPGRMLANNQVIIGHGYQIDQPTEMSCPQPQKIVSCLSCMMHVVVLRLTSRLHA